MIHAALLALLATMVPAMVAAAGDRRSSRIHHFGGFNIKGTPAMAARKVAHDLRVAKRTVDVIALQEFRWPWYWRQARKIAMAAREKAGRAVWRSSPGYDRGLGQPVFGAQALVWKARLWKRVDEAHRLLHDGVAKVSEDRYIRAVKLLDRWVTAVRLTAWFLSTHFVVGGDQDGDPALRKRMLAHDLEVFDDFLGHLTKTGDAVIGELDANIRPGGWAYREFRRILKKHGATLHGPTRGVEYLFTIDGEDVDVVVVKASQVSTDRMFTDHEGRVIAFRLVARTKPKAA